MPPEYKFLEGMPEGSLWRGGSGKQIPRIDQGFDVYVVATPIEHPHERKKWRVQLGVTPEYSSLHDATGEDSTHKRGDFTIAVINKRYSWIIGQSILNGEDGENFARKMAADGLFSGFQDIICIGAASREYVNREEEDLRARDRANILGGWVHAALRQRDIRVHALKVGRYDAEGRLPSEKTAQERQVVIVGIRRADEGIDLMGALRDAFARKRSEEPLLGIYLDHYPAANWRLWPIGR